jgi:hypothetical protein
MGCLTKKQILEAKDLKMEIVPVPEWADDNDPDAYVKLRTLTGSEREQFEGTMCAIDDSDEENPHVKVTNDNYRAKLCAFCMVDDEGNRLFEEGDIPGLTGKSSIALDRVFEAAQKMNGLGTYAAKKIRKN